MDSVKAGIGVERQGLFWQGKAVKARFEAVRRGVARRVRQGSHGRAGCFLVRFG